MAKHRPPTSKNLKFKETILRFFAPPGAGSSSFSHYARRVRNPKGSALVMAAIFMLVATTLITTGMQLIANSYNNTKEQQLFVGEAQNVAAAGIQDALGWFIRQKTIVQAYTNSPKPNVTPVWGANSQATPYTYVDEPFAPKNNTTNAQYSDTIDATIGIVNEFPIDAPDNTSAVYFGRYEVREVTSAAASAAATTTPIATPDPNAAHDVSGLRVAGQVNGNGAVWYIESTGYVYKRMNKGWSTSAGTWSQPYTVAPNYVVASAKLTSEFRKLSFSYPASQVGLAALYVPTQSNVTLGSDQCILNGAISTTGTYAMMSFGNAVTTITDPVTTVNYHGWGCPCTTITNPGCPCTTTSCYPVGYDSNNFQNSGICEGGSTTYTSALLQDSAVFGMTLPDIQLIADYSGNSSVPLVLPGGGTTLVSNALIYYNGNLTYGCTQVSPYQALNASGILVVNGNLTLDPGGTDSNGVLWSDSSFAGIVFVTGNLVVLGNCNITGTVIMGSSNSYSATLAGAVSMNGNGGSFGTIYLDPAVVSQVVNQVAEYREDISARKTMLGIPNL